MKGRGHGTDSGGRKVTPPPPFLRLPPEPPSFLKGEALAEWNRVVPELQRLHLVKPIDAAALTSYCLAWQRLVQAQEIIDREGLLHTIPQGRVRNPAVAIVEAASKDIRMWCSEFGLTPAAEGKVSKDDGGGADLNTPFG